MNNTVSMNMFVDTLRNNVDDFLNTTSFPGLILTVQRVLVQHSLNDTSAARSLIKDLLSCSSHSAAIQQLFKYMM